MKPSKRNLARVTKENERRSAGKPKVPKYGAKYQHPQKGAKYGDLD